MANNTENVTTKFRVDISDLKQGIAEANKIIKTANAEFKNATAGMDKWSDSADGLSAKIAQQSKIVDAEKTKLDLLKQQLDRLNKSQQDGEKIISDLTAEYNKAAETYGENSDQAKAYAKQLRDAQAAQERNAKAADDLNLKILNQDTAVKNAQAQVSKYETALEELKQAESNAANAADDFSDSTDDAADSADKLGESLDDAGEAADDAANGGFTVFKGVLSNLVTNVIDSLIGKITDLTGEAISAADSMAKFEQTMGFAGYDSAAIEQASADVKDYADKTIYELDTIANTTAQLAANGIKDYTGLTEAAGNLNAVAGGNAETFKSVAMVLTQTAGAGKLTTENWNQLADAIPGASGVLMQALKDAGAYTGDFREAMANGEITADEFNAAIMKLGNEPVAVEAATSVSTFEGAIGNLEATAVSGLMNIYDTIGRENVTKAINKVSKLVEKIIPPIQKAVKWFMKYLPEITAAVGALSAATVVYLGYVTGYQIMTKGLMSLSIAQKAVTAAQKIMNVVMAANPIGLIVAAIAGLVAAFVILWNKSEKFRNFWIGLWENIKSTAQPIIENVKAALAAFWEFLQPYIEQAKQLLSAAFEEIKEMFTLAWEAIKAIWDFVEPYFMTIWENIKAVFSTVSEVLSGYFSVAWEYIKLVWDVAVQYFSMIWENIKVIFSAVKGTLTAYFKAAWTSIKAVWDVVVGYFKMVWENIKLIFKVVKQVLSGDFSGAWESIKAIWDNVTGYFQTVWNSIKTIFGAVKEFFKTAFSEAWTAIKGVFNNVGEFFGGIWDTIKEKFTTIGTAIGDAIGGAFKNAINAVITTVENAINAIPEAINDAIDVINELPGVDISPIPTVSLPRLAKGGIVDRPTFAQIGEQGQEAIIPLENNKAGLKKIASLLANEINSGAIAKGNTTGGNVYNFNQTNNSPKALSRFEIYRQTKNLINAVKGV